MNYSIDSVSKQFSSARGATPVLENISLSLPAGDHVAILGSSGAGKTTLFRLLNATLRPSTGAVKVDGRDLGAMSNADLRATRRRIGTIYQQHNLVPSLTAMQNTLCGCLGRWSLAQTFRSIFSPARPDVEQAIHALELVDLADKATARADELSGGQQQRLAIARVLMQKPEVILADEPVASLDPTLADEIISLLIRVGSEANCTLVVSLHKVEMALEYFPRAVGLRTGRLQFDLASSIVNENLLQELYGNTFQEARRIPNENRFQRELGCR